jgi:hypothetical protein
MKLDPADYVHTPLLWSARKYDLEKVGQQQQKSGPCTICIVTARALEKNKCF